MPALDRGNRQFHAEWNQLWVSDFTYASTWQGWLYVGIWKHPAADMLGSDHVYI